MDTRPTRSKIVGYAARQAIAYSAIKADGPTLERKDFVLRIVTAFTALLLLTGCTSADWDYLMRFDAAPGYPDMAPAPAVPASVAAAHDSIAAAAAPAGTAPAVSPRIAAHCERTARDRASDLAAQNFDAATQERGYSVTYADCMKWAMRMH